MVKKPSSSNPKEPFLSTWQAPDNTDIEAFQIVHWEALDYETFFEPTLLHSFDLTHTIEMFDGSDPRFLEAYDRVDLFRFAGMRFSGEAYLSMDVIRSNAHMGSFNGLLKGWPWGLASLNFEIPECKVEVSVPPDNSFLIVNDDCRMCCGARASLRGYYPRTQRHSFDLTDIP